MKAGIFNVELALEVHARGPRDAARKVMAAIAEGAKPDVTVHKNMGGAGGQYQRWNVDLVDKRNDRREFPKRVSKRMAL